jgi:hypothetical protein
MKRTEHEATHPAAGPTAHGKFKAASAFLVLLLAAALLTFAATVRADDGLDPVRRPGVEEGAPTPMPFNLAAPTIVGTPQIGVTLSGTPGTWRDASSFAYSWWQCDIARHRCTSIPGATASSHTVTASDVGSVLRLLVTATGPGGSTDAFSSETSVVPGVAPTNIVAPTVVGTGVRGNTLDATDGTFGGVPAPTIARQWERCTALLCVPVLGATDARYRLVAADVGAQLRVAVTATNSAGSITVHSQPSETVLVPLEIVADPSISGSALEGSTLTTSDGSWTGSTPITYAYVWLRCPSTGTVADCTEIPDATDARYLASVDDVDQRLRARVTATNPFGSLTATSAPSSIIAPRTPVNTSIPTISGSVRRGETLTAHPGAWDGTAPTNFGYRWSRCASTQASSCTPIAGATNSTYSVASADVGHTLQLAVVATNHGGSASAVAAITELVPAVAPTSTTPPAISGVARDGRALTATDGEFDAVPAATMTRRWERCQNATCSAINSATGPTYTPGADDVGRTLRVAVTASNEAGSITIHSAPTAPVAPAPPSVLDAPSISGPGTEAVALTAEHGLWDGTAPITYAFQWSRCSPGGELESCSLIAAATDATYTPAPTDVGHRLRVEVTASNAAAETIATSAPSAVIAARAPASAQPPRVAGIARDGETLTRAPGAWTGTATIAVESTWLRCDQAGGNCVAAVDERGETYDLDAEDVGHTIRLRERASNLAGDVATLSQPTALVLARAPMNLTTPHISAPLVDMVPGAPVRTSRARATLTVNDDAWGGTAPLATSVAWERCEAPTRSECERIAGASARTYTTLAADEGRAIRAVIEASNAAGDAQATSDPILVQAPPQTAPAPPEPAPAPALAPTLLRLARPTTTCRAIVHRQVVGLTDGLRALGTLDDTIEVLAGGHRVLALQLGARGVRLTASGQRPVLAAGLTGLRWISRSSWRIALRSSDGRLRAVVARDADHATIAHIDSRLCTTSAPTLQSVEAQAGRPLELTVYATATDGTPLAGLRLTVEAGSTRLRVRTDEDGAAPIRLPAQGHGQLHVSYAGTATRAPAQLAIPIVVPAQTTVQLASQALPRGAAAEFAGRLVGRDGDPSQTEIQLAYRSPGGRWRSAGVAHADRHGRWRITTRPNLPGGTNTVIYKARVVPSATYHYEPGASADLPFRVAGRGGR